jgi:hypothetical protein
VAQENFLAFYSSRSPLPRDLNSCRSHQAFGAAVTTVSEVLKKAPAKRVTARTTAKKPLVKKAAKKAVTKKAAKKTPAKKVPKKVAAKKYAG